MIVGVVGAGPCGLHAAHLLVKIAGVDVIHLFESQADPGGRTRMGCFRGKDVVAGAGVVRARDAKLRSLAAEHNIPLRKFRTRVKHQGLRPFRDLNGWVRELNGRRGALDRRRTFRQNVVDMFGKDGLDDFVYAAGLTDYLNADVFDTLNDYGFNDNTSGQTMFAIDWNALASAMLGSLPRNVRVHLRTPVTLVQRTPLGKLLVNSKWEVDALFWTGPRPSWDLLRNVVRGRAWTKIAKGVRGQPFVRTYATPRDPALASRLYPCTTYMGSRNPLQKVSPYMDGVYMIAYADNRLARAVCEHVRDARWLKKHSGMAWTKPKVFYHECGTHYFRPLDAFWSSRDAFIRDAQHPAAGVYLCGEGLSRNQGWTEGALESAAQAVHLFEAERR